MRILFNSRQSASVLPALTALLITLFFNPVVGKAQGGGYSRRPGVGHRRFRYSQHSRPNRIQRASCPFGRCCADGHYFYLSSIESLRRFEPATREYAQTLNDPLDVGSGTECFLRQLHGRAAGEGGGKSRGASGRKSHLPDESTLQ